MVTKPMTRPSAPMEDSEERAVSTFDRDRMKAAAAEAAVAWVQDDMVVGLGSGSTASLAIGLLGERVAQGLRMVGIPTSVNTERQARGAGLTLSTLAEHDRLDLTIDGADEVELGTLNLLKGGGGALLHEKVVASASHSLIIVVDETKLVRRLGVRRRLPVEVVPFGWHQTAKQLKELGAAHIRLREGKGRPFLTEGGHFILDCEFGAIECPTELAVQLDRTIGVVEHGLFVGLTSRVVVGESSGTSVLRRRRNA
jgi:ribose 5-phosphate isomerase A